MVKIDDFDAFAEEYLKERGLAEDRPPPPAIQISRAPPPITPLRGSNASALPSYAEDERRAPNWQVWLHIPEVRLHEAVALSLDTEPKKLHRNLRSYMAGNQLFQEGQEFSNRLFVAERNLGALRPLNSLAMRYNDEEPVLALKTFVAWAISIGWTLPTQLAEATVRSAPSEPPIDQDEDSTSQLRNADSDPAPKRVEIQKKRDAVASWIAERYPDGIPAGTSRKEIARQFEAKTKVRVDPKTVDRALKQD